MPGALALEDLEPIREELGASTLNDLATSSLLVSDGALVALPNGKEIRLRTLVPATQSDGSCQFLQNDRCRIHRVAPFGCSHFDAHMSKEESDRRSHALCVSLAEDAARGGEYSDLTGQLQAAGRVTTPISERRAEVNRALPDGRPKP